MGRHRHLAAERSAAEAGPLPDGPRAGGAHALPRPRVADFAFPLPDRFKVRGRYGKWLLRKWLERVCPAADPWARKQGFTVPVDAWIAPRAADLGEAIGKVEAVRRLRTPEAVRSTFETGGAERWPLLFYAVWSLIHLEGAARATPWPRWPGPFDY
uniref:Asparagine synthetase domain-containing protein n=1 Tax=Phenylobacterium glaciei TaxID=2803784 RepID=A0A974S7D2_9CAUL|nr:hypothetical protein JKL49_23030 [Phenylobacterium glaciei]